MTWKGTEHLERKLRRMTEEQKAAWYDTARVETWFNWFHYFGPKDLHVAEDGGRYGLLNFLGYEDEGTEVDHYQSHRAYPLFEAVHPRQQKMIRERIAELKLKCRPEKWKDIPVLKNPPDVGYRAGGLHDYGEGLDRMDSGRGTGHFGSGLYFLGDRAKAESYDEKTVKRGVVVIDLTGKRLYRPKGEFDAERVHDALRDINHASWSGGKWDWRGRKFMPHYTASILAVSGVYPESKVRELEDIIKRYVHITGGIIERGLKTSYRPPAKNTAATRVMLACGWDGIDVRHLPDFDNTGYGSVLYDARKNPSEYAKERAEHPSFPAKAIRQIVKDHKAAHGNPGRDELNFHWTTGNTKLAKTRTISFDIYPKWTCPGARICLRYCFGGKGFFAMSSHRFWILWNTLSRLNAKDLKPQLDALRRIRADGFDAKKHTDVVKALESFLKEKLSVSRRPVVRVDKGLTARLISDLEKILRDGVELTGVGRVKPKSLRVHGVGDFDSQEYVDAWAEVARHFLGRLHFYAYTKSHHKFSFKRMPANFLVVKSFGGEDDKFIHTAKDTHALVFVGSATHGRKGQKAVQVRKTVKRSAVQAMVALNALRAKKGLPPYEYGSGIDLPALPGLGKKCPKHIGLMPLYAGTAQVLECGWYSTPEGKEFWMKRATTNPWDAEPNPAPKFGRDPEPFTGTRVDIMPDQTIRVKWVGGKGRGSLFQMAAESNAELVNQLSFGELVAVILAKEAVPFPGGSAVLAGKDPDEVAVQTYEAALADVRERGARGMFKAESPVRTWSLGELRQAIIYKAGSGFNAPIDTYLQVAVDYRAKHGTPVEDVPPGQMKLFNPSRRKLHLCEACSDPGHVPARDWQDCEWGGCECSCQTDSKTRKLIKELGKKYPHGVRHNPSRREMRQRMDKRIEDLAWSYALDQRAELGDRFATTEEMKHIKDDPWGTQSGIGTNFAEHLEKWAKRKGLWYGIRRLETPRWEMKYKNPPGRSTCDFCGESCSAGSWTKEGKPVCPRCTAEWAKDSMASISLFQTKALGLRALLVDMEKELARLEAHPTLSMSYLRDRLSDKVVALRRALGIANPPDRLFKVLGIDGRPFIVRLLTKGMSYGLNDSLTWNGDKPGVEFYDASQSKEKFGEFGQFTGGRYYVATLLADFKRGIATEGLNLHGAVPAWTIPPAEMYRLKTWMGLELGLENPLTHKESREVLELAREHESEMRKSDPPWDKYEHGKRDVLYEVIHRWGKPSVFPNPPEDETEGIRREMLASHVPGERADLEQRFGQVWDTDQVRAEFKVIGFMAPFVVVERLADGVKGSLMFQHSPRYYFSFTADNPHVHQVIGRYTGPERELGNPCGHRHNPGLKCMRDGCQKSGAKDGVRWRSYGEEGQMAFCPAHHKEELNRVVGDIVGPLDNGGTCPVCGGPGYGPGEICMDCVRARHRAAVTHRCSCGRKRQPKLVDLGFRRYTACERCLGTISQENPNIYGEDYLKKFEVVEEGFNDSDPEAQHKRNALAKKLRAEGWTVKVGKVSFSGFGYGSRYWLKAERARKNPLTDREATAIMLAAEKAELKAAASRPGSKERVFASGMAAGHGTDVEIFAESPVLRRRGTTLKYRAGYTASASARRGGVRKNPPGGTLIGRKCLTIETTTGKCQGNMGAVVGLDGGAVLVKGLFTKLPSGRVKAVWYADEAKAKREGMSNPGTPWKHDFSSEDVSISRCRGGILLRGKRPLWGMR